MKNSIFSTWLERQGNTAAVLGIGVAEPNGSALVESCSAVLSATALENAWRCVLETIPVMRLNRLSSPRFRFVFGQAVVHCERRKDGACVGIFVNRQNAPATQAELERLVTEFHHL